MAFTEFEAHDVIIVAKSLAELEEVRVKKIKCRLQQSAFLYLLLASISPSVAFSSNIADASTATNVARNEHEVSVKVSGFGNSIDDARRDAIRNAVQQVVGVYIDSKRRIEEKITDQKITTIIDDKIMSYTNAYVSHIDISSVGQKDGLYEAKADVTVNVQPLMKTINDIVIPTAKIDTQSLVSTSESLSQEKKDALSLYLTLMDNLRGLYKIEIGTLAAVPTLASQPNETWIRVPLTFRSNDDQIKEWQSKMRLIAQYKTNMNVKFFGKTPFEQQDCTIPNVDLHNIMYDLAREAGVSQEGTGQKYVDICFPQAATPNGEQSECLTRSFYIGDVEDHCDKDKTCPSIKYRRGKVNLNLDFKDDNGTSEFSAAIDIPNFPEVGMGRSQREPRDGNQKLFLNFCLGHRDPFFIYEGAGRVERIIMPAPKDRVDLSVFIRVPNDKLSQMKSVQAYLN